MKILLKIAYNGNNYCGWQVQKNGISVQGELCRAASEMYGCEVAVTGCSRTDAGVHALEYFCTLQPGEGAPVIPTERIPYALNVRLNEDVTVFFAQEVDNSFHARYNVKSKTYEYVIDNGSFRDPFQYGRAWHLKRELDELRMDQAAKAFVGKHDFSAFMASGSSVKDTVRTVREASVRREGRNVVFTVSADGFLYNMVRIMTGTLTDVSYGKFAPEDIDRIIRSQSRNMAGRTAPPEGLYLKRVEY